MSIGSLPIYLMVIGPIMCSIAIGTAIWLASRATPKPKSTDQPIDCSFFTGNKPRESNGTSCHFIRPEGKKIEIRVCPSCLGSGKQQEQVYDSADLQAINCEQCGGSGKMTQDTAMNDILIKSGGKGMLTEWEVWSWKGLLFILTIFEILTQSPLFILYLIHGGGPMENLTIWHYLSIVGATTFIPLLIAAIPTIALAEES